MMSNDINLTREAAWHLARTLMVAVVLFKTDGGFGFMEASEYDGHWTTIIHEYDPYSR